MEKNDKFPDPRELENEIGDFLKKKFGDHIKVVSPVVIPQGQPLEKDKAPEKKTKRLLNFDLKPEDLIGYLDQYIVKQDMAKSVLSTKICTHFNRIKRSESSGDNINGMVGSIKNNVIMVGPTGVGKTYIIKLIAKKIGVPFVKGDATKFSETGYVGGDVEDLVRDLVREADDNIELAQYGIIYIDEIDKIAGSRNFIGADVSRTGVQRALLKPLEETEIDLKVPHDPISMLQEVELFRKTGKREKRTVNTKNILFIMSGAFNEISQIIRKRLTDNAIGFGADITSQKEQEDVLKYVKSEDLIKFGFESEFVGRLPVRAIFESLTEEDLFEILKNPNNPIILGKKLDFNAYDIDVKFEEKALQMLAKQAHEENTGARGLVSAVEKALLPFERKLPSTVVNKFSVTEAIIKSPEKELEAIIASPGYKLTETFNRLAGDEKETIREYIILNQNLLSDKYNIALTPLRIDLMASYYSDHIMDIGYVIKKIKSFYDEAKKLELYYFKNHGINIVLEDDAIDYIIEQVLHSDVSFEDFYEKMTTEFRHGLKLIHEKTGKNRFFLSKEVLKDPENFISSFFKIDNADKFPQG